MSVCPAQLGGGNPANGYFSLWTLWEHSTGEHRATCSLAQLCLECDLSSIEEGNEESFLCICSPCRISLATCLYLSSLGSQFVGSFVWDLPSWLLPHATQFHFSLSRSQPGSRTGHDHYFTWSFLLLCIGDSHFVKYLQAFFFFWLCSFPFFKSWIDFSVPRAW